MTTSWTKSAKGFPSIIFTRLVLGPSLCLSLDRYSQGWLKGHSVSIQSDPQTCSLPQKVGVIRADLMDCLDLATNYCCLASIIYFSRVEIWAKSSSSCESVSCGFQ